LSVEPVHESVTEVVVMLLALRFAGVVGADRSPLPAAEVVPPAKSDPITRTSAVVPTSSDAKCRLVMMFSSSVHVYGAIREMDRH
jgi:hypothetical protein